MSDKKYCVVGIGYVGLPCAIMLANAGCKVLGFDIDADLVSGVNSGTILLEEELKELLLSENVRRNLRASTDIEQADIFIVATPTPIHHRKKHAELSALIAATESVASVLKTGDLVIVESTIPPLTLQDIIQPVLQRSGLAAGEDFFLAHCPERLLPGNVVHEITYNNRIVGGITPQSAEKAAEVYRLFVKSSISVTDDVTAELCKLIENTYRDVNIALSNELCEVCSDIGVDVDEVIDLANLHPRVNLLKPGIGVGGHCLPIDPWFIHEISPYNSTMIMAARHINDARPAKIAAKIRAKLAADVRQDVLILGKTYKPETNDTRESPAIEIIEMLKTDGYRVHAWDPYVDAVSLEELAKPLGLIYIFVLVPHKCLLNELEALRSAGGTKPEVIFY